MMRRTDPVSEVGLDYDPNEQPVVMNSPALMKEAQQHDVYTRGEANGLADNYEYPIIRHE
jgi:Tat protein secretion system quality control protein TatD with DNase activity